MSTIEVAVPAVPAVADPVAETLERAAELLSVRGWIQGANNDLDGAMCARGAILEASGSGPLWHRAEERLCDYLDIDSVVSWNDAMCMTAEDVIRALNEAAAHGD